VRWLAWATALLLLAGVLGSSAGAKLVLPGSFRQFRDSLPSTLAVPAAWAGPLAAATVTAEALLAAGLVSAVFVPALAMPVVVATIGLLGLFTGALVVMIRRGVRQSCHCFGAGDDPPTGRHVLRNALLLAIAAGPGLTGAPPPPDLTPIGGAVPYLPQILAGLTAVVVVNTVLVVLVLRNQREQLQLLRRGARAAEPEPIMADQGERVRAFSATTVDGQTVTRASLVGETLVAFVSPTCPACAESLPGFIARAQEVGERDRVLAVVLGPADSTGPLVEQLAPVARVVTEPEHGPLSRAFSVSGYPAFALLREDTVVSSHFLLEKIPVGGAA
jgi:hypothetical protein